MRNDIVRLAKEFSHDLVREARRIMSSDIGVNEKTLTNTLHGSDLYNKLKDTLYIDKENLIISVLFNFYAVYINWERPEKYMSFPKVSALIKWIESKNICPTNLTVNQFAYLVGRSIWEKGHKARLILDTLMENTDKYWENYYEDKFYQQIIKPLTDYFNS